MNVLLRDFGGMLPLTAVALPLGLLCWQMLVSWRRRRSFGAFAAAKSAIDVAIVTSLALILCLVTMPVASPEPTMLHLVPGTDVRAIFDGQDTLWQVLGNLLLFAPLGALVPLRSTLLRSHRRIIVGALTLSVVVEFSQFVFAAGRVTSVDDVLLNVIGAALGGLITRHWWQHAPTTELAVSPQVHRSTLQPALVYANSPISDTWMRRSQCRNVKLVAAVPQPRTEIVPHLERVGPQLDRV